MMAERKSDAPSPWVRGNQADPWGARMADRHYSRKTKGARLFVGPGRKLVLYIPGERWPFECDALWVWYDGLRADAYTGWWNCSLFRNERPDLYVSSALIRAAVLIILEVWGAPRHGFDSYVWPDKLQSSNPGYCYQMAGWQRDGWSKDGKKRRLYLPVEALDA